MTLAYRYHAGISTPRNCEEAAFFYKRVADKAMDYYLSGPPGGMHLPRHNFRIADEDGGVYGEGASFISAGPNRKRGHDSSSATSMDDIIEYLLLLSNKGELSATYQLAKLYYEGPRGMQRDLKKARDMFSQIAKKMWSKDGKETVNPSDIVADAGSKAAGYLGRMYLRGEAVPQDLALARRWFARGLKFGDVISQHGMGYLYEKGLAGIEKNLKKAQELYKASAEDDYGPSQVALGKLFYNRAEYGIANKWFELATRHGNVEAYYYLAEINNQGNGRERSCGMATLYYKHVSEKVEALQAPLEWAHKAFKHGQRESALLGFMMAAEQGYESGQANVAWLLDEQKSKFPLDRWRLRRDDLLEQELALMYWTRSAKQQNIDSFVKMGDYYLNGIGTEPDSEKAAACYIAASEFQQSAQALWNLGWMHENGIGVEQDYHLAKRYYDQALESNSEAYLPVTLSLLKLRVRNFWNTITGGKINALGSDPEPKKQVTFREWMKRWFSDEKPQYTHNRPGETHENEADAGVDSKGDGEKGHDAQRNDYYNHDDQDFEDDVMENMLILGIMVALAVLVWVRNHRQQQQQQRQQQQQQPGQNGQAQPGLANGGAANNAGGAAAWQQGGDPRNNPWGIPPPPGF
ncbi:hypothetical protein ABW19_dt0201188 [Dactylella cylindrospora]|nr:hypothetical protein ABW19_dt0201188 [Dactylella cylindrospora]